MFERLHDFDTRLSEKLRGNHAHQGLHRAASIFAHSGDSWYLFALTGLLWWLGGDYWKSRALILIVAMLITALLVMILKFSIRRRRPEGEWGNIYRKTDPHSFPSGHAARAAMIATVGLGIFPTWAGVGLCVWALLVGYARIWLRVHYALDILGGIVIGVILGIAFLSFIPPL